MTLSELINSLESVKRDFYMHSDPKVVFGCFASVGSSYNHVEGVGVGITESGEMVLKMFEINDCG